MKFAEFLKSIGINTEAEIDDLDDKHSNDNNSELNLGEKEKEKADGESQNNIKDNKEENKVELKYDKTTGLFDLSGIEDEGVKAVLTEANNTVKETANRVKIDKAIGEKLGTLNIIKGVTPDAIRSLLDTSKVKVNADGKVVGLDEAVDNLKTAQSGLFVAETKESNTSNNNVVSSPVLEGFNPALNGGNPMDNVHSIEEAIALEQSMSQ